jgi:hypothetical protein
LKDSIASQARFSWWGKHWRQMISKKCVSNNQWKLWDDHWCVIKFLTIHVDTMEAYTLWWNGETLRKMLEYNTKYSPIMVNHILLWQGGPDMKGQTWLVAFRQNRVKLAWAFINIMNAVYHCGILHNLSKDNIMLHFPLDKPYVRYIGVCKGARCHQCKKKCIGGLPHNCFLFIAN